MAPQANPSIPEEFNFEAFTPFVIQPNKIPHYLLFINKLIAC